MTTYEKVREILAELDSVFSRIDEAEVDRLVDAILSAAVASPSSGSAAKAWQCAVSRCV